MSQKFVEMNKAVAAGTASVVTAVFTSKLGVAGTLIGTGLTAVLITLTSAILKAQLERASHKISGLPGAVQGRLSTQQVRIPGKPNPVPEKEPATAEKRLPNLRSRLRAIPGFLKELPSSQRRKVLTAGILAGLVATVIGLGAITGIELADGKTFSCQFWASCGNGNGASTGSSSGSGPSLSILGGGNNQANNNAPPSGVPSGGQRAAPGNDQQPGRQGGQPGEQPDAGGGAPQPGGAPKGPAPEQRPKAEPNQGDNQGGGGQASPPR